MRRSPPWLAAVLLIACVALGYWAFREHLELVGARAKLLDQAATEKQNRQQIGDLQHKLTASEADRAKAQNRLATIAQNRAERRAAAANGKAPAKSKDGVIHVSDILKDHPEYAALHAKEVRRNVQRTYGDAIAGMNLPPDEVAKLKDLLVEQQMSEQDAQQVAEEAGLQRGTKAWAQAMSQAYQTVQQDISSLLGPAGSAQLQQAQMASGFKTQVEYTYAPDFAEAGVALTSDQAQSLAQAMAAANNGMANPQARTPGYRQADPETQLSPYDNQVLAQAAQVLSPAQLQILKTDQAENNQRQAIMRQYIRGNGSFMIVP